MMKLFKLPPISIGLSNFTFKRTVSSIEGDKQPEPEIDTELLAAVEELTRKSQRKRPHCVLCKFDIVPDYKNFRLLSQFISPYSGLMYPMHITGLCLAKHKAVHKEIERARRFGFINRHAKHPEYYNDFPLFRKFN